MEYENDQPVCSEEDLAVMNELEAAACAKTAPNVSQVTHVPTVSRHFSPTSGASLPTAARTMLRGFFKSLQPAPQRRAQPPGLTSSIVEPRHQSAHKPEAGGVRDIVVTSVLKDVGRGNQPELPIQQDYIHSTKPHRRVTDECTDSHLADTFGGPAPQDVAAELFQYYFKDNTVTYIAAREGGFMFEVHSCRKEACPMCRTTVHMISTVTMRVRDQSKIHDFLDRT